MNTEINKHMRPVLRHTQTWLLRCVQTYAYACGSTSEWSPVFFASSVMLRTDLATIQGDPGSSG